MAAGGNDQALRLYVDEFMDGDHWRWRLADANGNFLTDYAVSLDPTDARHSALLDLPRYLKRHADPDKWPEDEARLLGEIGEWIGEKVLGPIGPAIVRGRAAATVRVILPSKPKDASGLISYPLELGHVNGRPLALRGVSLVYEMDGEGEQIEHPPVGETLRMLAIFSLPTDQSALALRRERYQLQQLIKTLRQTRRLAIDLRIIQYGATRETLADVLDRQGPWDVIHFSGHGLPASLVLEKPDGTSDLITSDELRELLEPARGQVKLVSLSSCLSAAATLRETMRWLGIELRAVAPPESDEAEREDGSTAAQTSVLARVLARDLDCAVLAMRYSVGDDFAINLGADLYDRMFRPGQQGQSLAGALQRALPAVMKGGPSPGMPPVSVATPALVGRMATNLKLTAPRAQRTAPEPEIGLAYFPNEPQRFVGRVGPMTQAGAALADECDKTGVVFYGMAGAGKTACALELTYRYQQDRFTDFVWYKAPDEAPGGNTDIRDALVNFALAVEQQLGLSMAHVVDRADEFEAWLPQLTEHLGDRSVLFVLDNLESLLTPAGAWRDPAWEQLIQALLAHNGVTRVVMTSRLLPADLANDARVLVEPIHALSLSEAALLARELPDLGKLMNGKGAVPLKQGRELVSRTLLLVQGHPKLIELANGVAADADRLSAHLDRAAADLAGQETRLDVFFDEGESNLDADGHLAALKGWTQRIAAELPEAAKTLFWFLCCLEEADRNSTVVEVNWADFWKRLERAGDPPDLAETLAPLTRAALVDIQPVGESVARYAMHPGVAEAGKAEAGATFQEAVDRELAAFWHAVYRQAREQEQQGGGQWIVTAGLSAAPYLLRLQDWEMASSLLEQALH